MSQSFFFNRRTGIERRSNDDQRINPRLDLPHRRRRKNCDRRGANGSPLNDFLAMIDADSNDHWQEDKH